MALVFGRSGQSTGGVTTGVSYGFICDGTDRVLIAFIDYGGEPTARTPSAVTYGGVAMTAVPGGAVHDGASKGVVAYYLINPAGGTNTFSCTFAATVFQLGACVISYHGAHQTAPVGTVQTDFSTTTTAPSITVASSAGRLAVAGCASGANVSMSIVGGTSRLAVNGVGGNKFSYAIGELAGGGTVNWTYTAPDPGWSIVGLELIPSDYLASNQGDAVRFYPRFDFPDRMRGATFEGTDGDPVAGTYTTIFQIPWTDIGVPVQYNHQTNLSLGTFRYLRCRTYLGCYGNMAEVEFWKAGVKVGGTVFGSPGSYQSDPQKTFDKALDGNTSTFFDGANPDNQYAGWDTGAAAPTLPDPFTRADSADLGSTYDPGYSQSAKIVSNAVTPSTAVEAIETWNANVFSNNQFAEVKISSLTNTGSMVGVVLRATAPPTSTFYWVAAGIYSGTTYTFIKKRITGTDTQLLGPTQAWAVGDVLRAEINGTTITVKRNGATVHTTTDAAIASGRIGIYIQNDTLGNAGLDDFNGGDYVAAVTGKPQYYYHQLMAA